MKRNLLYKAVLCAFCFIAGGFLTQSVVKADVIWEPDDPFYQTTSSSCYYEDRDYVVNSEAGYVYSYSDPYSTEPISRYENGTELRIAYTYNASDGSVWGLMGNNYAGAGWVCLDEFELVYDHKSFCEDHAAELVIYDDRYKDCTDMQNIVLWKYPNSGEVSYQVEFSLSDGYIHYLYVDENGHTWAYVPYIYLMSGWIYVDDPTSTDLSVLSTKEPVLTEEPVITADPVVTDTPVTMNPTITPDVPSKVTCVYSTVNSWSGGFIGQIDITNNTEDVIDGWNLFFNCDYKIQSLWGGTLLTQEEGKVTVANSEWDSIINPGDTKSINFNAAGDIAEEPGNFVFED